MLRTLSRVLRLSRHLVGWGAVAVVAPGLAGAQPSAGGGPPRWALRLRAQEFWDSARLLGPEQPVHFTGRLGAGLAHGRGSERASLVLSGGAASSFYHETNSLGRWTYDGSLVGGLSLGARTRLTVSDTVHTDYSDESPLLAEEGTVLPRVFTRENRASVAITHRWSPRTSFSTGLQHDIVGFDSESVVDRSRLAVSSGYRRQLSRSQTLGLTHLFLVRSAGGRSGKGHRLAASWSGTRRRQTLSLSAGVERVESLDTRRALVRPYGAVTLSSRWNRSGLALTYERSLTLAYESLDDRVTDTVGLAYDRALARRLGGVMALGYSLRRDAAVQGESEEMLRFNTGLTLTLRPGLDLGLAYSFQGRRGTTAVRFGRHRVELGVSYGRLWR